MVHNTSLVKTTCTAIDVRAGLRASEESSIQSFLRIVGHDDKVKIRTRSSQLECIGGSGHTSSTTVSPVSRLRVYPSAPPCHIKIVAIVHQEGGG
jgi:hypothetical protein